MIKNIDNFIKIKQKQQMFYNLIKNKKETRAKNKIKNKARKIINLQNNNMQVIKFIDYVYNLETLHKLINWYVYYIEKNINEYMEKQNNIKLNKINLK